MRNRKQKQRDLLLTTFIDLLIQILFLFLLMVAFVSIAGDKSKQKAEEAQQVENSLGFPLNAILEKWRRLIDPEKLLEEQKHFLSQKADYERLKQLEAELAERDKIIAEKEKALGTALGYRPCWSTSKKQVDSIFRIMLSESGIIVTKDWPPMRDVQARKLPIVGDSLGHVLSVDNFRAAFKGVYEAGAKEKCVYYVVIADGTSSVAKSYEYSQVVEKYFYSLKKIRVSP